MDPMDPKQASRCQECHRDFHFYGLFERHLVDIHGEDEVLHCATCNTSFKRKMNLVLHWRSTAHRETKLVGCDICDAFNLSNGFPTEEALADHTSTVHGPKVHLNAKEQAEYFCPICQKKFTHRKGMIEHLQVLHGEHLYGHMLREEGQAKADLLTRRLYRCEDCQKSFRVKSTLNRHREKFHDDYSHWSKNPNRGKPENQQIAAQFLSQQQSSPPTAAVGQVHASPRTAAGRVYSCADCGQTFSSATTLSVHTEMVHNITTVNAASEDEDVEQVLEESEPVPVIQRQGLLGRPVVRNGRNPHLPALAKRPKTEELPPPITTDSSSEDDEDSINRRYAANIVVRRTSTGENDTEWKSSVKKVSIGLDGTRTSARIQTKRSRGPGDKKTSSEDDSNDSSTAESDAEKKLKRSQEQQEEEEEPVEKEKIEREPMERNEPCELCDRKFFSYFSMMRHVAFTHRTEKTMQLMKLTPVVTSS